MGGVLVQTGIKVVKELAKVLLLWACVGEVLNWRERRGMSVCQIACLNIEFVHDVPAFCGGRKKEKKRT